MNEKRRRANALMMKYYSGMIDEGAWRHASGDIAFFNTKYRRNLKSLVVQLEPIQAGSGEPSPDNVRPISGWTGATIYRSDKNMLIPYYTNDRATNGIVWTVQKDSNNNVLSYTANGTATAQSECSVTVNNMILPPGNYIFSGVPEDASLTTYTINTYYRSVETGQFEADFRLFTPERQFTLNTACQVTVILRIYSGYTADSVIFKPMIRPASITDATYKFYTGTAFPVSWETEAGTIYGGTIDVISGKLTVDMIMVDLGSLLWNVGTTNTQGKSRYWGLLNGIKHTTSQTSLPRIISTSYIGVTLNQSYSCVQGIAVGSDNDRVWIYDDQHYDLTAEQFTNYISGIQLVYELATPQIYQLTPQQIQTLIGDNVMWSDAGPVSVEYWS